MEIGVQINEFIIISLLDTKDKILKLLEQEEIRYKIHTSKNKDNTGKIEEILLIPEFEAEARLIDNKVVFIRALSSEYTRIFQLNECNRMTVHKYQDRITAKILETTKADRLKINLESLNLRTLCSSIYCKCSNTESKLGIVRDGHGNVYIQTIKLVKEL